MTITDECPTCKRPFTEPERSNYSRAHDPDWRACPICHGSKWVASQAGSRRCGNCEHGYVPISDDEPAPLPAAHTPVAGLAAAAKAALTQTKATTS